MELFLPQYHFSNWKNGQIMCTWDGSKINLFISFSIKNSLQFMNTTTQWSSQIKQSIRFELNNKYPSWVVTNMHLSSFYNVNTIVLSCNMSQYVTNQHTTQKSHTTLSHYAKEHYNNKNNLHFTNWKTFKTKTIIFVHWLPFWNTNKSDKNMYMMWTMLLLLNITSL
jgi:hypothetical protein